MRRLFTAVLACAAAAVLTSCTALPAHVAAAEPVPPAARTHVPSPTASVLTATAPDALTAAPLRGVAVLVHRGAAVPAVAAVTATARAAGATVIAVSGDDPRADPAAIRALAALRPREVVAIGRGVGPAALLASRVATAATGTQLPGGGQVLCPGHRLIALYGHPGAPSLGVRGHQELAASIARARQTAAAYRRLSRVPVVPAFEIIATVAQASAGADGTYSYVTPPSALRPWVRQATAAGMYVILDLQPGRASLLAQAERYRSLL